jgi:large subunit ribosomal protein L23
MDNIFQIIQRPLVTERATNLKALSNQYVFRVSPHASKGDIKRAVEQLFKVKVVGVNTLNATGKYRRMGNAPGSHRPDWKKAFVTLAKGQEIKILEEGQAQ